MIFQASKKDCVQCESAFSHLWDAKENFDEQESAEGEVYCIKSMMSFILSSILMKLNTSKDEERVEFPCALVTGEDWVKTTKLINKYGLDDDEGDECQDGVCSVGPLGRIWDFVAGHEEGDDD